MYPSWSATNSPTSEDISTSDVVCIVKKTRSSVLRDCRRHERLIVLDVVDFWPQPKHGMPSKGKKESENLVVELINDISPDALIFPNWAMWSDFSKFFPTTPSTFIYHHYRPEYDPVTPRQNYNRPRVLAYEGGDYLGEWFPIIESVCSQLGLDFRVNPTSLKDADLIISARAERFQTYLNRNYKSNVKAANALGLVKPLVCHMSERSAHEIDPGTFLFFSTGENLLHQLHLIMNDTDFAVFNYEQMLLRREYFSIRSIASEFDLFFYQVLGHYGRDTSLADIGNVTE